MDGNGPESQGCNPLVVGTLRQRTSRSPAESQMLAPVREQLRGILDQRGHDGILTVRIVDYVLPDVVSS